VWAVCTVLCDVTWYDQLTVPEAPDGGRPRLQGRIGSVIKDKWRIDARLGSGGMATVYAATHRNGNRVAIKMLHPDFSRDPTVRARFLREGYVANAVGHPGTVRVLDDDVTEDGAVFLVMELLEGESLEVRRERLGGRLPVEEVFTVGDQLLDLLTAAHAKGIIHRDIKPENIFVTNEGAVKVLDFGIAQMRHMAAERTGTGLMLGTPDFMSPEQAGGNRDEIDARSDIWAVGATMFTLLSGESVHRAETLRDHLIALSTTPARSLAVAAPWVPPQLVAVVDRALELRKDHRWPDARAMQDALRWAYKAVAQGPTANTDSITVMQVVPPSSNRRDIPIVHDEPTTDEKTRVEPMTSVDPVSEERTLMAPPPQPSSTEAVSKPPTTPQLPKGQAAQMPPPYQAPQVPTTTRPLPPYRPGAPPTFGASGSGSGPAAIPAGMPPLGPGPFAPPGAGGPGTLGAQFTDPRVVTGTAAAPRRSGRAAVMVLLIVFAVLAGIATFLVSTGLRESPFGPSHDTIEPQRNAKPPESAAPLPSSAPRADQRDP
jgi:serine/threonine-protein kinase